MNRAPIRWACLALVVFTSAAATASPAPEIPGNGWREEWPEFSGWEFALTGSLSLLNVFSTPLIPTPTEPRWFGGLLFDDAIREHAIKISPGVVNFSRTAGDKLYPALVLTPIILDSLIMGLLVRQQPKVAWQSALISAQSLLLSSTLNLLAKRLTARTRPNVPPCDYGDPLAECPRGGAIRSFFSGHSVMATTGAALLCANHAAFEFFGGGLADHLVCAISLGTALFVSASRIAADAHHTTDVLAGIGVGLLSGFVLPRVLHYRIEATHQQPIEARLIPTMQEGGGGLSLFVTF